MHVARFRRKEQRRKDFLNDRADRRERQASTASTHTFVLDVRVRDGSQHDMMVPAGIAPAFEVIQPELAFKFLVLLFDRPALMGQPHERAERCRFGSATK